MPGADDYLTLSAPRILEGNAIEIVEIDDSDNLKIRPFSEGLFSLYDGLVRLPNAMPRLDPLLAEITAVPDGKHDDQVDPLSYIAAYSGKGIHEARRWGLKLGSPASGRQVRVENQAMW